jgi:hypothetical protein
MRLEEESYNRPKGVHCKLWALAKELFLLSVSQNRGAERSRSALCADTNYQS